MTRRVLQTFEIDPQEPQRGSVLWMHGLGASNHDFDDVVPLLQAPWLRFVFPAAPERPVTINGGMKMPAWYDILTFQDPPLREKESDVRQAAQQLERLVQREVERGVSPEGIVVMGFSQGAAMALHLGLRSARRLAGVASLSGYLVLPGQFDQERTAQSEHIPFFFGHGVHDPVVPIGLGRSAHQRLLQAGYDCQWREYPMQHSLCMEEIVALRSWLHERFQA